MASVENGLAVPAGRLLRAATGCHRPWPGTTVSGALPAVLELMIERSTTAPSTAAAATVPAVRRSALRLKSRAASVSLTGRSSSRRRFRSSRRTKSGSGRSAPGRSRASSMAPASAFSSSDVALKRLGRRLFTMSSTKRERRSCGPPLIVSFIRRSTPQRSWPCAATATTGGGYTVGPPGQLLSILLPAGETTYHGAPNWLRPWPVVSPGFRSATK